MMYNSNNMLTNSTYKILETETHIEELFILKMKRENNTEAMLRLYRVMSLEAHRMSYPNGCLYLNSNKEWIPARDYQFDAVRDFVLNHDISKKIENGIKVEKEYNYDNDINFTLIFEPNNNN